MHIIYAKSLWALISRACTPAPLHMYIHVHAYMYIHVCIFRQQVPTMHKLVFISKINANNRGFSSYFPIDWANQISLLTIRSMYVPQHIAKCGNRGY